MVTSTFIKAFKYVLKKPYTRLVPASDRPYKSDVLRGTHVLDMSKCTGCSMCQQVCPAACIDMVVVEGSYHQNPRSRFPRIDHGKCTFCALCVEYCPFNALSMTDATGFELFTIDKSTTFKEPRKLTEYSNKITVTKELFKGAYQTMKVEKTEQARQ
ncbi:MAG: 4Fe-4S binding protein [Desulfurococcaceae archaeon TW002]